MCVIYTGLDPPPRIGIIYTVLVNVHYHTSKIIITEFTEWEHQLG